MEVVEVWLPVVFWIGLLAVAGGAVRQSELRLADRIASYALLALGAAGGVLWAWEPVPTPEQMGEGRALPAWEVVEEIERETLAPHEIDNIAQRRDRLGDPGTVQYVAFLSRWGQPVDYFVADGKCTSSGKRLLRPQELVWGQRGEDDDGPILGQFVADGPSADGTFGTSQPTIYCFTTDGAYKEWSGEYYVSDRPIELSIAPLVVSVPSDRERTP